MNEAAVSDARSRQIEEQREQALRGLLATPLMRAGHRAFPLVRMHTEYLRDWLARECGWSLQVERDFARLSKQPADSADSTRGAEGFQRNRYALLCLALAVLEREDVQITLHRLGERLIEEAADPALEAEGFSFALDRQSQRRDLVQVCRLLLELGVLTRVAGEEEAYINQSGDALYDIHRPVLSTLLASERGPSILQAANDNGSDDRADWESCLQALATEYVPEGETVQRTAIRHRLSRRLLDDPVVYLDSLDAEERDYFVNQRGVMARRLGEATGMTAEHRAEGSALIDENGDLSDVALPQQGTDAHATLLLAEHLAQRLRNGEHAPVAESEVRAFMREAARAHRKYWRKATMEAGAEAELAGSALNRLRALRLVRIDDSGIWPLPAVCRFKLGEATVKQRSLLD